MLHESAPARQAALDFDALQARLPEMRASYAGASPFPHIVIDDLLFPEVAAGAVAEFSDVAGGDWLSYVHINERKYANTEPASWGPNLRLALDTLQSPRFVALLSQLTSIDGLLIDDSLEGGGLHRTPSGGFLNVHADFTVHPKRRNWRRRVNIILYLNADWPDEYGGHLELWSRDMKRLEQKVTPVGNRAVIFNTDHDSFHGHPDPLRCPPDMGRCSLALYYFTEDDHAVARSTEYRARPGDGARSALIYADKQVLRVYDWLKRRSGLSDERMAAVLRRIDARKRRRQT